MGTRDPRIDAYIERSAEFARPILSHLREVVHAGCPDVEETMKWSMPHFTHRGMLCGMASFKAHCAFGFWRGAEVLEGVETSSEAMGQFGCIRSTRDLPPKRVMIEYVKRAARLNEEGKPAPRASKARRDEAVAPDDLLAALRADRKARAVFEKFPPSHRREYIEWIMEAKRPETRARRIAQAVEWMREGKQRNWKYQ